MDGVTEIGRGYTGWRCEESIGYREGFGPGDTNDSDAAFADGGRDCCDCIFGHASALTRAASIAEHQADARMRRDSSRKIPRKFILRASGLVAFSSASSSVIIFALTSLKRD